MSENLEVADLLQAKKCRLSAVLIGIQDYLRVFPVLRERSDLRYGWNKANKGWRGSAQARRVRARRVVSY